MKHPVPIAVESKFGVEELFFSTTDAHGVIRFGNDVFSRVSGYALGELIGKPHNIIRHPDMPRAVFRLLWEYLEAGKQIAAYVKNMAADGSYYWVVAVVAPMKQGYLSIRLKPTSPLLREVEGVYGAMLELERAAGSGPDGRKRGMREATDYLVATLGKLGFSDYDAFMHHLLLTEVRSRRDRRELGKQIEVAAVSVAGTRGRYQEFGQACEALSREQAAIFSRLDTLMRLQKEVGGQIDYVRNLGESIRLMSLNAMVQAENFGGRGLALQAVAQQICRSTQEITAGTDQISQSLCQASDILRRGAFAIPASDLSVEMMSLFLQQASAAAAEEAKDLLAHVGELGEIVSANISSACTVLSQTAQHLAHLEQRIDNFAGEVRRLSILHVTGKIEASRINEGETVLNIFDSVFVRVTEGREKLSRLAESLSGAKFAPPDQTHLTDILQVLSGAGRMPLSSQ